MVPSPPVCLSPDRLVHLRHCLQEAGYTHERLAKRVGIVYVCYHPNSEGNVAAVRAYLERRPADTLDALIHLFFFSEPVELAVLESCFGTRDLGLFEDAELLQRISPSCMAADLCLMECGGLYLVTDTLMDRRKTDFNNVAALLPECYDLEATTLRRPFGKALDLCTGSGVHALLASRHCGEAVGVDISARAVEFARFNKALNGIDNAEFALGDLYEPVADERFDLVLSNPPYIPDLTHEPGENYYSAGVDGDAISSRIFADLEAHLNDGGFYQGYLIMVDWPGNLFRDRLERYLAGSFEHLDGVLMARPIEFDNDVVTGESRVTYGLLTLRKQLGAGGRLEEGHLAELWQVPRGPDREEALTGRLRGTLASHRV